MTLRVTWIARLLLLSVLLLAACDPSDVDGVDPEQPTATAPAASTPVATPRPAADIEATIQAVVQATIAAQPTSTPVPTPTPIPTPTPSSEPPSDQCAEHYTVQDGDTLSDIAYNFYLDASKWQTGGRFSSTRSRTYHCSSRRSSFGFWRREKSSGSARREPAG